MEKQPVINRFYAEYVDAGMPTESKWYKDARERVSLIAERFSLSVEVVAAVVAVLSPRQKWVTPKGAYPNLDAATRLISGYVGHRKKADVFANVPGFDSNKEKAWKIVRTGNVDLVSGPKVTAFYHNLVDPLSPEYVTIDSWMIAIALGGDVIYRDKNNLSLSDRDLQVIRDALRHVADMFSVHPVDMQAILWESAKKKAGEVNWRFA